MLHKKSRINKSKDFDKIFKKTRPVFGQNLSVRVTKRSDDQVRFGFIVSNKVDKRSTRRNALKRQLRAIASLIEPNILPGSDIIITVKRDFDYPYDQTKIKEQVLALLKKCGAIKN